MTWLRTALAELPGPDADAGAQVRERAADILRPAGALARFDEVAVWVAEWQHTSTPAVRRPAALIFAADHGVTAAGVSKYPIDVTAAMLAAYRAGRSTVSACLRASRCRAGRSAMSMDWPGSRFCSMVWWWRTRTATATSTG